jgi:gliding motility-associated-like protein
MRTGRHRGIFIIIPLICWVGQFFNPSVSYGQLGNGSQRVTMGTGLSIFGYTCTVESASGTLAAAGSYTGSVYRNYPMVSMFSKSGTLQWNLNLGLGEPPGQSVGSVTAMHASASGDLIVAGWINTNKSVDIQFPYEDAFLARISPAGAVLWVWRLDRNRTDCIRENYFRPFLLTELPGGDLFMAADQLNCLDERRQLVMTRFGPDGGQRWTTVYEGNLGLSMRGGVDTRNGLISFWSKGQNTGPGNSGLLEKFQVDPQTGRMVAYKTWAVDATADQTARIFSGENIQSQLLPNGHTIVTGVSTDAYGLHNEPTVIFSALEFDEQDLFIKGYHITPAKSDSGTVALNIKPGLNGTVVMQRNAKLSAERRATDLAVFQNGTWLSQRRFADMEPGQETPDPVHLFTDGSFALLNQYQGVVDYYYLQQNDQSLVCLGNTNPGSQYFVHRPAFYRPIPAAMPRQVPDTINGLSVSSFSVFQEPTEGNRLNLGADQTICSGNGVTLTAPYGFQAYRWSNGEDSRVITVYNPGIFYCTVTDACGSSFTDSVQVKDVDSINLLMESNVLLCPGQELRISAPDVFKEYRWGPDYAISTNPGSPELRARPGKDTSYFLEARHPSGCKVYDTVQVQISKPVKFSLAKDLMICPGDSILLTGPSGPYQYRWNSGSSARTLFVREKGIYTLTVLNDAGCPSIETTTIRAGDCPQSFFMPNAFTPNGDGLNDQIRPVLRGSLLEFRFSIFNRWGQMVFSTVDPDAGWDGRVSGQLQPGQVFTWKCDWKLEGGAPQQRAGTVVLIRQ